jgi:hypothetical protein
MYVRVVDLCCGFVLWICVGPQSIMVKVNVPAGGGGDDDFPAGLGNLLAGLQGVRVQKVGMAGFGNSRKTVEKNMPVSEARKVLMDMETEKVKSH